MECRRPYFSGETPAPAGRLYGNPWKLLAIKYGVPLISRLPAIARSWRRLLKKFGAEVNLGPNLDIPIICKLEATRRTPAREGGYTTLIDRLKQG